MPSNAQKTPIARAINRAAERRVSEALGGLGKELPCRVVAVSENIVTVSFEIVSVFTLPGEVTCPGAWSQYGRPPIQVGEKGVVMTIDTYLGGISGLGGGTADLTPQANLSSLVYVPVSSRNWSPSDNANAYLIYGPDGAIIRDSAKATTLTVSPSLGVVVRASGGAVITANLVQAVDDTAAALAGVPIDGLYRNISSVHIRTT